MACYFGVFYAVREAPPFVAIMFVLIEEDIDLLLQNSSLCESVVAVAACLFNSDQQAQATRAALQHLDQKKVGWLRRAEAVWKRELRGCILF